VSLFWGKAGSELPQSYGNKISNRLFSLVEDEFCWVVHNRRLDNVFSCNHDGTGYEPQLIADGGLKEGQQ
jgi:hypothetical protein